MRFRTTSTASKAKPTASQHQLQIGIEAGLACAQPVVSWSDRPIVLNFNGSATLGVC